MKPTSGGALYATVGGVSTALVATRVLYPSLWQDLRYLWISNRASKQVTRYLSVEPPITIVDRFLHQVQLQPDKPFLLFEDEVYTYRDVDVMSNKVANFFRGEGYRCGDTVAMLIYNEPAFIWTFLGLAKLGVKMAFLNTNLRTKSLLHCFNVSEAKALIVGQGVDLFEATLEILPELQGQGVSIWVQGDANPTEGILLLDEKIATSSAQPIPFKFRSSVAGNDALAYINTSGTTGLPKAAIYSYEKATKSSFMFTFAGIRSSDVVYVVTPLYHSSAFGVGFTTVVEHGATMALARKFSASRYWDDCRKHNVTLLLYIGEMLRYLCVQPKRSNDRDHKVRAALGNGLAPAVWKEFQDRFGIRQIVEFYGATESNIRLMNITGKRGSVGMISPLIQNTTPCPLYILKVDLETGQPIRDDNGLCIKTQTGEPGLLICPISKAVPFQGYKGNKELTEKKVLRDVFKKGDAYFDSGDLMKVDKDYHVYFVDRLGDTFRWKSENVATTEVAQVLHDMQGVDEVNVYGVKVPGSEGRAGMAAAVVSKDTRPDLSQWYAHIESRLPSYARPLFLRLTREISVTGTLKQQKTQLVREGFDPTQISDPLYFRNDDQKTYVPLDLDLYRRIALGKAKL
ncbi:very long-chain acyl-CoA synthetase-like [Branchiostoma floridae]|uniref:long-chain-fatty-acid--CoA ligase n=1 Tax=Branchiostoma floridae TaxID=7739 RepID=A0A9J7KQ42_BRAFL|nr:very long-chain acyl-CoA synthetase-like [Branchiostoma floridae]